MELPMDLKKSITIHPEATFGSVPGVGASHPHRDIDIECPPDKSLTHRCLMFAAMAKGQSTIASPLLGADCRSTLGALVELGVQAEVKPRKGADSAQIVINSGGWDSFKSPLRPLDFGNSGTTTRLLMGVLASTPGLFVTVWGDASLSSRPMGRVVEPLRRAGAHIVGRERGGKLPLAIDGRALVPCTHESDKASAQVKSALILAALNIDGETTIRLPRGSRDHTEKALQSLGAKIKVEFREKDEWISVKGPFRPEPKDFRVPGDPSSAAFFCVLGAIRSHGQVTVRGVLNNPTRTGFLEVLSRMGLIILRQEGQSYSHIGLVEPVMDLTIKGGQSLKSVVVEPELIPKLIDEIPILAVAASFAPGISRFVSVAELKVKESDRLLKTIELINSAGQGRKAWAEGEDLLVQGAATIPDGFHYDPQEDHRMAMAAAILAKGARGPCVINDPQCVVVSFPEFFYFLGESFDQTN